MHIYLLDKDQFSDWWIGWQKPEQVYHFGNGERGDCKRSGEEFHRLMAETIAKARGMGWKGDIREGPFVTVIPHTSSTEGFSPVAIGWKQNSNGSTFIASEVPLPWFEA